MGGLLRDQVREVILWAVLGRVATPTSSDARLSVQRAVWGPSWRADVSQVVYDPRRAVGASNAFLWGDGWSHKIIVPIFLCVGWWLHSIYSWAATTTPPRRDTMFIIRSRFNANLILCTNGDFMAASLVCPGGYAALTFKTEAGARRRAAKRGDTVEAVA